MLGHLSTTTACSAPVGNDCTFYVGSSLHYYSMFSPSGEWLHILCWVISPLLQHVQSQWVMTAHFILGDCYTETTGYSQAGDMCHFCTATAGSIPAGNTKKLCTLIHNTKPKIWTNLFLRYLYYNITLNTPKCSVRQGTIITDSNQRNNP